MKSPIFIFSLPRSGSTLLQRVLSGHTEIATAAEPWILLPYCYANRQNGLLSEYSHSTSFRAVSEFTNGVGKAKYNKEMNKFVSSLYQNYCLNGECYFIDKTPRYYLIIKEIREIFPKAKFIFLFRNPLHVIGSVIDTFSAGGLGKVYHYRIDFTEGFNCLSKGYELIKDVSYSLRYEDFVTNPRQYVSEICTYLELDYQSEMLDSLSGRDLTGSMGDPVIKNLARKIDVSGLHKWKKSCSGIYRKSVVRSLVEKMSPEAYETQGYSKNDVIDDVSSLSRHFKSLVKDFIQYNLGHLIVHFKLNILLGRSSKSWTRNKYLG